MKQKDSSDVKGSLRNQLDKRVLLWHREAPLFLRVCVIFTHTHTHTHTHVGFYGLRGLSIGVIIFILYKLYVLLPYTYPTPKLSPHRRLCISTSPKKLPLYEVF